MKKKNEMTNLVDIDFVKRSKGLNPLYVKKVQYLRINILQCAFTQPLCTKRMQHKVNS